MTEFKAKMVDGKLVVEAQSVEVENADGTKSVRIMVPSLAVVNNFVQEMKKREEADNG